MKKEATDMKETDLVKALYVTSSLLLDSPYVRLLHALVTDKVSGGDIVYYMEIVPTEDEDDFKLLDDGRIDRSFYEVQRARLPQMVLTIADNLYSEIAGIADRKSSTPQELWKNCNFISLKARYSRDWDSVVESVMKPNGKLIVDGVNLSLLYEKSKMLFTLGLDEDKKDNLSLYMAEALYWLSFVGMSELCFYIVCMIKESETTEQFLDIDHPNYEDLILNPTAKNLKRYLASVDLSKGSMHTLNQIQEIDDFWVHLYDVFHPFSLLISNYESHLTWRLSARSRKFFEIMGLPSDPSNEHWVTTKTIHEEKITSLRDEKNDEDNDENDQSDSYDQSSGVIDDRYHADEETANTAKRKYRKTQNINYELVNAMRTSVVQESQYFLKAFPLLNALRTYKLRGNPRNLIGYINEVARNEFTHQATKKDGVFSSEGYYNEKYGVSKRTIQRAKKSIKVQRSPGENPNDIGDKEISDMIENNKLKRKHQLVGYLTQNKLCSLIALHVHRKDIKCSVTTIRNIIASLRRSNLIEAKKEGSSYFFKQDSADLRMALEMVEKEIRARKIRSNKSKTKSTSPE